MYIALYGGDTANKIQKRDTTPIASVHKGIATLHTHQRNTTSIVHEEIGNLVTHDART